MREPSIRLDELCVFCRKRVQAKVGEVVTVRVTIPVPSITSAKLAQLLTKVCKKHEMDEEELLTGGQTAALVRIRADFSVLAHNLGYSYPEIGKALHRHHTSIVHLVQKANGNGNNDQKSS